MAYSWGKNSFIKFHQFIRKENILNQWEFMGFCKLHWYFYDFC